MSIIADGMVYNNDGSYRCVLCGTEPCICGRPAVVQPADAALLRELADEEQAKADRGAVLKIRHRVDLHAPRAARLRALATTLEDMRQAAWDADRIALAVTHCEDSISNGRRLLELTTMLAVALHTLAPPPPAPESP